MINSKSKAMIESPTIRQFKYCPAAVLLLLVILLPGTLFAALDHEPLQSSASLTFEQVFDSALANAPEGLASRSRSEQTEQYEKLAASLFPGQPVLEANYVDDSALDSVGLRELEAGLRLNLWRPGERQQSRILARDLSRLHQAWQDNLALEVAGRVRDSLWVLQQAEAMLALEQEALAATEQFEDLTMAQFAAGSVAERDVLQARTLRMTQQQAVYAAEAAVVDAERDYTVITGLQVKPDRLFQEQRSTATEISISHPLLQFLQANAALAGSRIDQVRRQSSERPSITFGVRRERGSALDDYIDSLGVGVSVPLGRSATVASQVSDARREEADMQVALQRGRIMLNQQLHEAEHQLFTTEQQLELAETQASLTEQQWEMASTAYELGEADAVAVVLALRDLIDARKRRSQTELRMQQLISEYNQSLGQMP